MALWQDDRFSVALDCSQLDSLGANEVRTFLRFADQFAHYGGFVRLTNVSGRIRALVEVLNCADLLASVGNAGGQPGMTPFQYATTSIISDGRNLKSRSPKTGMPLAMTISPPLRIKTS